MGKKIQRVELTTHYSISIYCPFCGQRVSDVEAGEAGGDWVKPCIHTLFVGHDEGFEYRSERFNAQLVLPKDDDEINLSNKGIDGLTDQTAFDDAVKFAAYVGPPSGFGSYVGFAPVDDNEG
jgi:hypothetical protein